MNISKGQSWGLWGLPRISQLALPPTSGRNLSAKNGRSLRLLTVTPLSVQGISWRAVDGTEQSKPLSYDSPNSAFLGRPLAETLS